jgi:hypothetical protein
MENVSVTSYKTMQGGPKGALGGGGLLDSPSGFNPGGASPSRSPAAAAAAPAGAGVGGMRR